MLTHTRVARGRISGTSAAKCRDNCSVLFHPFPSVPSSLACPFVSLREFVLFFFNRVIPRRGATAFHRERAREPSAKSHVLSITSTRNTSRCVPTSCLDVLSPRSSSRRVISVFLSLTFSLCLSSSVGESHDVFEIAERGICLVLV